MSRTEQENLSEPIVIEQSGARCFSVTRARARASLPELQARILRLLSNRGRLLHRSRGGRP